MVVTPQEIISISRLQVTHYFLATIFVEYLKMDFPLVEFHIESVDALLLEPHNIVSALMIVKTH
jgi:hypothetical protein